MCAPQTHTTTKLNNKKQTKILPNNKIYKQWPNVIAIDIFRTLIIIVSDNYFVHNGWKIEKRTDMKIIFFKRKKKKYLFSRLGQFSIYMKENTFSNIYLWNMYKKHEIKNNIREISLKWIKKICCSYFSLLIKFYT